LPDVVANEARARRSPSARPLASMHKPGHHASTPWPASQRSNPVADALMTPPASPAIQGLFEELYTFGDSLTSYGDFASYIQKTVLAASALPAWSGVSFSNANFGCQLGLRSHLGISTPSETPPPKLDIPTPFYPVVNPYVATPDLGTAGAPSFAIGGATSGSTSLYDVITVSGPNGQPIALSTLFPKLARTGVEHQIEAALQQGVRPSSNQLTLIQGASNDF